MRRKIEEIILSETWDCRMRYRQVSSAQYEKRDRRITTFKNSSPETLLFDRYVSHVLSKAFQLRTRGRDVCIRLAKDHMSVYTSKNPQFAIIRADITTFFDSIEHKRLATSIANNGRVPKYVCHYVDDLCSAYEKAHRRGGCGIAQGIPSSAKLAEVALQDLDRQIAMDPHVGIYLRYVDDIFVVCLPGYEKKLLSTMENVIEPWGLRFKKENPEDLVVASTLEPSSFPLDVSYLGYKFSFNEAHQFTGVDISDAKKSRYMDAISRLKDSADKPGGDSLDQFREKIEFLLFLFGNDPTDGRLRTVAGAPYSCRFVSGNPQDPESLKNLKEVLGEAKKLCCSVAKSQGNSAAAKRLRARAMVLGNIYEWLAVKPLPFQTAQSRQELKELIWG